MKDLKLVKEENEISILSNGSSLISQRKLAALLGVKGDTLKSYIRRTHQNANTSNGLDENTAYCATTYYAYESKTSTQQARDFLKLIGAGGIRAYNYHQAGVPLNATPQPQLPQTLPDALRAYADEVEEHDKTKVVLGETKKELNSAVLSLENKTIQLDQSKEYFSVKRVAAINGVIWKAYSWHKLKATGAPIVKIFDANYGEVNAYHHTAWTLAYPDAILK